MTEHEAIYGWLTSVAYAALAAIGGILGHTMRKIDRQEKISWSVAALEGVAAGFTGFLILLACNAMGLSDEWKGVIVGVCGWLGAHVTIRILEKVIYKQFGLSANPPTDTVNPHDPDSNAS